jgi:two-component system, NarL family, response regulator NreC
MASRKPSIRIMIADDHAILRAGLKMLINAQVDMEVVGEAANGDQAIQAVRETIPDVALMDLTMPQAGGTSAIQEITNTFTKTRVLVLTMHDDPAYLRATLAAGASGYVLKRSVDAELLAAIRAVHRGGVFVDPSMAGVFVRDVLVESGGKGRSKKVLSDRELQVLGLVARGYSSPQIAEQIFLSVKTVETYRARFADKLGLRTRSDIVRFAVQMGLLTPQTLEAEEARRAR